MVWGAGCDRRVRVCVCVGIVWIVSVSECHGTEQKCISKGKNSFSM